MSINVIVLILAYLGYTNSRQVCPSNLQCLPIKECRQRPSITFSCNNNGVNGICCKGRTRNLNSRLINGIPKPRPKDEREPAQHKNSKLLPSNCGENSYMPINKIQDGDDAFILEYPWIVYIVLNEGTRSCSGVIINERYILTAGHCVSKVEESGIQVFAGMENTTCAIEKCPTRQRRRVEKIILHDKFRYVLPVTLENDIALLRLKRDLNFMDGIRPVCLPLQREARRGLTKNDLTLLGWGKIGNHKILQKLDGDFVPYAECATKWKTPETNILVSQICIYGKKSAQATQGDSGGPLQMEYGGKSVLVGITSYGPRTGRELPFVLVKVAKYLNWILDNIQP